MQTAIQKLGQREGGPFGEILQNVILEIPFDTIDPDTSESTSGNFAALPPYRTLDHVFQDYEQRAIGAQRIMQARREEQDAYEHALETYTKLRTRLESQTGSMWEETVRSPNDRIDELVNRVNVAAEKLGEVRKRYQTVAISTTDELRRLRTSMHDDLTDSLRLVAEQYARQHTAHSHAWALFAKRLDEHRSSSIRRDDQVK